MFVTFPLVIMMGLNPFALPSQPFFGQACQVLTLSQNLVIASDMGEWFSYLLVLILQTVVSMTGHQNWQKMAMAHPAAPAMTTMKLPNLWHYRDPPSDFNCNQNSVAQLLWQGTSCHSGESEGMEVVAKVFLSPWGPEATCFLPNILLQTGAPLRFSLSSQILHARSAGSGPTLFFIMLWSSWCCSLLLSLMPVGRVQLTKREIFPWNFIMSPLPGLGFFLHANCERNVSIFSFEVLARKAVYGSALLSQVIAQLLILGLCFILPVPSIANLGA